MLVSSTGPTWLPGPWGEGRDGDPVDGVRCWGSPEANTTGQAPRDAPEARGRGAGDGWGRGALDGAAGSG